MKKLTIVSLFLIASPVLASHYEIDSDHSSVAFKIRHMFSKTIGHFKKFKGQIEYSPDKNKTWSTNVEIEATSLDTDQKKRDEHLRSAEFFDVKKFPKLVFVSKEVSDVDGNNFKLKGDLTIHGITKPVVLSVETGGEGTDPWGNKRRGFTATTKINRKDFGLTWNKALETGGFLIGEDVEINIEIEALQKEKGKMANAN